MMMSAFGCLYSIKIQCKHTLTLFHQSQQNRCILHSDFWILWTDVRGRGQMTTYYTPSIAASKSQWFVDFKVKANNLQTQRFIFNSNSWNWFNLDRSSKLVTHFQCSIFEVWFFMLLCYIALYISESILQLQSAK